MYYILYNNNTKNLRPEIDYGNGIMMPFKIGYILFDANTNHDYSFTTDSYIIDGLSFTSKSQVYAKYLTLKIDEMTNNGASVFFPDSFNILKKGFSKLYLEKPELLV